VGLKNMSICIVDFHNQDFNIKLWANITLRGKNISDYSKDVIEKLRAHSFGCLDYVLIEQQINRNTQMKVISHVMQTFFICEVKMPPDRVKFVSPKKRLDSSSLHHGTVVQTAKYQLQLHDTFTRQQYKMLSVAIARIYLSNEKHSYWRDYFESQEKRDDFADSLVQAIAWNASSSVLDID